MCISNLIPMIGVIPIHIHDADKYMIRNYVEATRSKGFDVGLFNLYIFIICLAGNIASTSGREDYGW